MIKGFTTMGTPGISISETVDIVKKYGFDSLELRLREDGEIKPDIAGDELENTKNLLSKIEDYGLFCYNETHFAGQEKMESSMLECLELAEKTGAKRVRFFTGKIETEEEYEVAKAALKNVSLKYKGDVKIRLQNHSGNGLSCEQGIKLISELNDKRITFIFSPDECLKRGEEYLSVIPEIAKITDQIFIADMTDDNKYCLIGEGIIPFDEILKKMKENGFDGHITLKWEKCWCDYLPTYEEGFPSFINYLEKYNIH